MQEGKLNINKASVSEDDEVTIGAVLSQCVAVDRVHHRRSPGAQNGRGASYSAAGAHSHCLQGM